MMLAVAGHASMHQRIRNNCSSQSFPPTPPPPRTTVHLPYRFLKAAIPRDWACASHVGPQACQADTANGCFYHPDWEACMVALPGNCSGNSTMALYDLITGSNSSSRESYNSTSDAFYTSTNSSSSSTAAACLLRDNIYLTCSATDEESCASEVFCLYREPYGCIPNMAEPLYRMYAALIVGVGNSSAFAAQAVEQFGSCAIATSAAECMVVPLVANSTDDDYFSTYYDDDDGRSRGGVLRGRTGHHGRAEPGWLADAWASLVNSTLLADGNLTDILAGNSTDADAALLAALLSSTLQADGNLTDILAGNGTHDADALLAALLNSTLLDAAHNGSSLLGNLTASGSTALDNATLDEVRKALDAIGNLTLLGGLFSGSQPDNGSDLGAAGSLADDTASLLNQTLSAIGDALAGLAGLGRRRMLSDGQVLPAPGEGPLGRHARGTIRRVVGSAGAANAGGVAAAVTCMAAAAALLLALCL